MGTTLSSCGNECGRQRCNEPIGNWLLHPNADERRFCAEVYRLSADKRQWVKVHPDVLSFRLNNKNSGKSDDSAAHGKIAFLEATTLCHQYQQTATSNNNLLSLPIVKGTQLKRYTEKFVYWHDGHSREVFALNLVSPSDLDCFCSTLQQQQIPHPFNCLPPTTPLLAMSPKIGSQDEQVFEAHIAPLMALHRDRVELNPVPLFAKCKLLVRQNADALIQIVDDRDGNLLVQINPAESIFGLTPSADQQQPADADLFNSQSSASYSSALAHQLCMSFPTRAFLLQFPSDAQQLAFVRCALNASSIRIAGTKDGKQRRQFIGQRLASLETILKQLNDSTSTTTQIDVGGAIFPPSPSPPLPPNPPTANANALPLPTHPPLLFVAESTAAAAAECPSSSTAAIVIRRRQSMASLLRYVLRCQMAALDIEGIAAADDGKNDEKLAKELRSWSAECLPASSTSSNPKLVHQMHRLHLQAIHNSNFSIERTVHLLGQFHAEQQQQQEEEKAKGSTAAEKMEEEENDRRHKFRELKLAESPKAQNCCHQLGRIMMELVQSERAFVDDLHMLLMRFVLPSGLKFLQCVLELHRIHSLFLRSLQEITKQKQSNFIETKSYEEIKPLIFRLCALFIGKCAQFKVYSDYTFSHMQFQQLRNENASFNDWIGASFSASFDGGIRALDSLLIKPVQRLLKYPLFLGQLREFCAEGSEERAFCVKALKQMRMLANWLNEMQRIKEDYGTELISLVNSSSSLNSPKGHVATNLNSLQLFAHVRWLNPPNGTSSALEVIALNCALFVFRSTIVILERKRSNSSSGQQLQQNKEHPVKKISPIILPIGQVHLLIQQKLAANSTELASTVQTTNATHLIPALKGPPAPGDSTLFALALCAQTDAHMLVEPAGKANDSKNTNIGFPVIQQQQQQKHQLPTIPTNNLSCMPLIGRLYHFECCHPEVCRHLALALRRLRQQQQEGRKHQSKEQQEEDVNKISPELVESFSPSSKQMIANNKGRDGISWRMETSIDSTCSSSSDRGYASGNAVDGSGESEQ